jgi:hypothetical protein
MSARDSANVAAHAVLPGVSVPEAVVSETGLVLNVISLTTWCGLTVFDAVDK